MAYFNTDTCPVCSGTDFTDFLECTDHFVSGEKFTISQCVQCEFKITSQIPDEASIGSYYQSEDYISHSDTSRGVINRVYHIAREFMLGRKRKAVLRQCRTQKGSLLDIGAGTGYFAAHMSRHGWQVSGTEKSDDARNRAKTELQVDLLPAEALFSLRENSFDAVTLWHVMEHFYRLQDHIHEMNRILKPDGILFVALPNHLSYDAVHYREHWAAFDVPRHIWHFAPHHVQRIFEHSGFVLIKKIRMPLDSFYISMMSEKYKKSAFALFKGVLFGAVSWMKSLLNKDHCSSLIYVLRKN